MNMEDKVGYWERQRVLYCGQADCGFPGIHHWDLCQKLSSSYLPCDTSHTSAESHTLLASVFLSFWFP